MGNKITENPKIAVVKKENQESVADLIAALVLPSVDDQNMPFDLQFDHILAELSEINKTADDVVQSNIEALGAISANGERIDRLNRDNEHSLARLVTGSVA
ncbi:MAG: hypothetical protein K2X10_07865 [Hyphomicrobiales bacterium]|nr:hypothetical protein [Hyphomicrobiales bacterium]